MNTNRSSKLVKFVVLALLTTCIGASLASAQTAAGKFSLPFEVRWGQAVIAPGNYSFTVNSSGSSPANTVFVRGENGSPCMIVPLAHDYSFSGKNELIVSGRETGARFAPCVWRMSVWCSSSRRPGLKGRSSLRPPY